ncbi:hypothetical protein [Mucilaginibacter sp.]|uniref:hypothetical protein n=1 Tax=Mucilaginibacter sp. TaxID=1882438 RepID=UPI000CB1FAFF|nr:hypothetical protein [Mucilaginibacter sp.]PLW89436.1 MAG: hypothetical protein C0154_11530 [Mucilaginibacter sp.]
MKNPAVIVLALLLLVFISIYFIIPEKIKTTNAVQIDASDMNVARYLVNKRAWQKWWPGKSNTQDSSLYTYKNMAFTLHDNTNGSMPALISYGNTKAGSSLTYNSIEEGSCMVYWTVEMQTSLNPVKRVQEYLEIKKLGGELQDILRIFKKFMQADSNVYGFTFGIKKIDYEYMMVTATQTTTYPANDVVYKLINQLKNEAGKQHLQQLATPMLNVHQTDENAYQVTVALPVNKPFSANSSIKMEKMVLGGNLLQTSVNGGPGNVKNAFRQLKRYQKDHHLISPAMPYELLVTDRSTHPDTSQWHTTLSWPIF